MVSWGSGRLDIFARAANNTIRHRAFDANSFGWGPWEDFGGTLASGPSAVSWGSGRLDAFIWNTDGYLWQLAFANNNWAWARITDGQTGVAQPIVSAPAAVSWGFNRIDVFSRGPDNQLWQAWWPGPNGWAWTDLDGVLTSAPAVESWGANRLDVFLRGAGTPANVFHRAFDPSFGWGPNEGWGGPFVSGPSVVSWGPGRLDAFSRHQIGNNLWELWWQGTGPYLRNAGGAVSPAC